MRLELACKMGDGDWLGRVKFGKWDDVYFPHRGNADLITANIEKKF